MSALVLKLIAIFTMFADHLGVACKDIFANADLGDVYYLLRAVGRLSLPIFAFLIANGFKYTKSAPKYALRLFCFALISEIPFDLFIFGKVTLVNFKGMLPDIMFDNVFFTLLIGLVFLWLRDIYKKRGLKHSKLLTFATYIVCMLLAAFISADYGAVGVSWIALFGILDVEERKNLPFVFAGAAVLAYWNMISRCILVFVYRLTKINLAGIPGVSVFFSGYHPTMSLIQAVSLLAIGLILFYNGKSGKTGNKTVDNVVKYGFYVFYPLHLLILYLVF